LTDATDEAFGGRKWAGGFHGARVLKFSFPWKGETLGMRTFPGMQDQSTTPTSGARRALALLLAINLFSRRSCPR
jgi:hypothetical protein